MAIIALDTGKALQTLGIGRIVGGLKELTLQAARLVRNAVRHNGSGCEQQASGIEAVSCSPTKDTRVLVIDIGGSHTKVGYRSVDSKGNVVFQKIADFKHEELNYGDATHSMQKYSENLMDKLKERLGGDLNFSGVSVVWSNGMTAADPLDGKKGNSGVVADRAKSYNKGEFFCRDLKDGDNILQFLSAAMGKKGIKSDVLLIGNDTVFTLNAGEGFTGGVVCATGANGTIVKLRGKKLMIFNAESGANFIVPTNMLTKAEIDFLTKSKEKACLEFFCAGGKMGQLFEANVQEMAGKKVGGFKVAADLIRSNKTGTPLFTPEAITALAKSDYVKFRSLVSTNLTDPDLKELSKLAFAMEERAGVCGAILSYMSIIHQAKGGGSFKVALDSTIAKYSPVFMKVAQETLEKMLKKINASAKIVLMKAEGEFSVPMMGAANSIDPYLQKTA